MNDLYSKVYIYLQLGFRGALLYKRDKRQCVFYSPELWGINAMVFIRMLWAIQKKRVRTTSNKLLIKRRLK